MLRLTQSSLIIVRNIRETGPAKPWNVVLVCMESMSARFMSAYGNTQGITPNLDRFANEGLFFSQLYATGTRTVRGLEAIILSLPLTPGQSILRRPDSGNLFNLGTVFRDQGYVTQFLYGGNAYFDNMREWFSSNQFDVIDEGNFSDITFSNAWGVSDEDLFNNAIKVADSLSEQKKPFLQVIMTTSNHRPYTFPEGRIDIPSHSGRDGAVKYADYAIGKLIADAEKKSWYKNTLFVFVADHNASVAGGTDIPIKDYLIPLIMYNPTLVKPQKIVKLASQIDLAPTLLDVMNVSYQSKFFGQSLLRAKAERALLGTYQKIAWMKPGEMIVLSPGKNVEKLTLNAEGEVTGRSQRRIAVESEMDEDTRLTVSIYQTASELFHKGLSKLDRHYSNDFNVRDH
jgi:phosphoglycerol transferase MdoB-like AlkP superfamily enzyme